VKFVFFILKSRITKAAYSSTEKRQTKEEKKQNEPAKQKTRKFKTKTSERGVGAKWVATWLADGEPHFRGGGRHRQGAQRPHRNKQPADFFVFGFFSQMLKKTEEAVCDFLQPTNKNYDKMERSGTRRAKRLFFSTAFEFWRNFWEAKKGTPIYAIQNFCRHKIKEVQ